MPGDGYVAMDSHGDASAADGALGLRRRAGSAFSGDGRRRSPPPGGSTTDAPKRWGPSGYSGRGESPASGSASDVARTPPPAGGGAGTAAVVWGPGGMVKAGSSADVSGGGGAAASNGQRGTATAARPDVDRHTADDLMSYFAPADTSSAAGASSVALAATGSGGNGGGRSAAAGSGSAFGLPDEADERSTAARARHDRGNAKGEENLDAPLLLSEAEAAAQNRRRSNSVSSAGGQRRRSSSGDGAAADAEDDAVPASASRQLAAKLKETSWAIAADVLDHMPNSVTAKLFVPSIPGSTLDRLFDLQESMLTPFSHDVPEHQQLVPALWAALTRLRPPLPMAGDMDTATWRSELWKDYGFQGMDPATDFRGAGLLGARCIIWMCVEEPDISRAMLDTGYPFAIAVINVVMACLNILHITRGRKTCLDTKMATANYTALEARVRLAAIVVGWQCASATPGLPLPPRNGAMSSSAQIASMEDGLMNCVAEACRVLHGEWLRSSRNVMEFNSVLKAATAKFEKLLRDKETYIRVSRTIDKKYPEAPLSCAGI